MKKFLSICLVLGMCMGLVGCSDKPSDLSDENYELGIKILETADKYLDGDLSADDAESKIDILKDRIDSEDTQKANLLQINSQLLSFEVLKSKNKVTEETLTSVKEVRDDIADILGKQ